MKTLITAIFLSMGLLSYAQQYDQSQIDQLAQAFVTSSHNQGLIIGIIDQGQKQILAYGETNKGSKQTPKANSIFEIGGLSSLFTTTLLARMSIQGEISVDMPIQSLMPEQHLPVYQQLNCEPLGLDYSIYACEPYSNDETISILLCNLATHTAGFPLDPSNLNIWFHPKNPYARYKKRNLYKYLNNQPVNMTNGFDYRYSNVGMALLGHGLSLKTSSPYQDLLIGKVLAPLRLADSRITLNADQQLRFLQGHTEKGKVTAHWDWDVMAPAAGMRSSMEDMIHFLSVHMGLSDQSWIPTVKFAQNPRETIKQKGLKDMQVGLGWLITPMPGTNGKITWHAGQTSGFASYIGFISETNIGVVILSNQATPVSQLGVELLHPLHRNASKKTVFLPGSVK